MVAYVSVSSECIDSLVKANLTLTGFLPIYNISLNMDTISNESLQRKSLAWTTPTDITFLVEDNSTLMKCLPALQLSGRYQALDDPLHILIPATVPGQFPGITLQGVYAVVTTKVMTVHMTTSHIQASHVLQINSHNCNMSTCLRICVCRDEVPHYF